MLGTKNSFRRRGPYYVGPPTSASTPVTSRVVQGVKVVLRQPVLRKLALVGAVLFVHPPHGVAATPVVSTVPKPADVISPAKFKFKGSVVKVQPVKPTFDPKKKRLLPIQFVPRQNFKNRGKVEWARYRFSESTYTSCTYAGHFITRGWNSPQDQVDAGYPIFIQPTSLSGYYEEVIDYGTTLTNNIATVLYNENVIVAGVTTVIKIASSLDNITYTAFTSGSSLFISSMRYLKIRLEFTGADDHALTEISNLEVRLDVKREVDSDTVDVFAADTAGTVVTFNKTFKDIDSITLTPLGTTMQIAIYDFVDIPNPTDFKILLFDSAGSRIDGTVSWKARGIV